MKISRSLRRLFLWGILALCASRSARAQFLLIVNDGNISNVTITSTGTNSGVNDSTTNEDNGVDLLGFFTSDIGSRGTLLTGNFGTQSLTPAGVGDDAYDLFASDNFTTGNVDLNLFIAPTFTQAFSTGSPAFTGVMAGDFSNYTAFMPTNGTSGNILAGYSTTHGAVIGEWTVVNAVPEPASFGLLAGATALFALAVRKLQARAQDVPRS